MSGAYAMPGTRCAVAMCKNSLKTTENVSFHRFPINKPKVLKTWVAKCGRGDKWNPNTSHICSVHFAEQDFEIDLRHQLMGTKQKWRLKNNGKH